MNFSTAPRRIHYLQHDPIEDALSIHRWAKANGHVVSKTALYEHQPLPNLDDLDWLIMLGGPMNIDEHDQYPWLVREKQFITQAIEQEKPVLGICLGAQLIAACLGGRVTRNPQMEIGWFPVRLLPPAETHPVFQGFPREFMGFHWHGDTFSIPPGATRMAESDACPNQAFVYGERVIGLQFHLEVAEEEMALFCQDFHIPSSGPSVQSAAFMKHEAPRHLPALQTLMETLFGNLSVVCK